MGKVAVSVPYNLLLFTRFHIISTNRTENDTEYDLQSGPPNSTGSKAAVSGLWFENTISDMLNGVSETRLKDANPLSFLNQSTIQQCNVESEVKTIHEGISSYEFPPKNVFKPHLFIY